MEIFRIIISMVADFAFLYGVYILYTEQNTKWLFINKRKISIISCSIGLIISFIRIVLNYLIYDRSYTLMIIFFILNLLLIIGLMFRKKNNQKIQENFEIQGNKYKIYTVTTTRMERYSRKKTMLEADTNKGKILIELSTVPSKIGKNIILECEKIAEKNYFSTGLMYNQKKNIIDVLSILVNYLIMICISYGLAMYTQPIDDNNGFILYPLFYVLLRNFYINTKYGKDFFVKFEHILCSIVLFIYLLFMFLEIFNPF